MVLKVVLLRAVRVNREGNSFRADGRWKEKQFERQEEKLTAWEVEDSAGLPLFFIFSSRFFKHDRSQSVMVQGTTIGGQTISFVILPSEKKTGKLRDPSKIIFAKKTIPSHLSDGPAPPFPLRPSFSFVQLWPQAPLRLEQFQPYSQSS